MQKEAPYYDVAIVGGGLAGLALSILLAKKGYAVALFEKEQFPFHKVCGEYISLESWNFLVGLGVDLDGMNVPVIKKLQISAPNGKLLRHDLSPGGFGISRFRLDHELAKLAISHGVVIKEKTKVNDIIFDGDGFTTESSAGVFKSRIACGSFGKRSNIDIKWNRKFSTAAKNKLNNYIGVKYHARGNFAADTISLHNFRNGYCGIVKVDENLYNICYLTTAENLQRCNGDIHAMEREILGRNPHLQNIFSETVLAFDKPLTISQISFDEKSQVENHVLMLGDAAGMITPLCGNGMSMALHSSKLASIEIGEFLSGRNSRQTMEEKYASSWRMNFEGRLKAGRRIQTLFGKNTLTSFFISMIKPFPSLIENIIRRTHGKPF